MKWDFVLCNLYHIAGEFGGELNLAVWQSAFMTIKLKICQHLLLAYKYIYMAIPY